MRRTRAKFLAVVAGLASCLALPAEAGETLVEGETLQLRLGGYVSEFAAVQQIPYADGQLIPEESGQAAGVLRFEWDGQVGDHIGFVVHNRFFHRISTDSTGLGNELGLGASATPERTLDARTAFIDEPNLMVEHDLDRAMATFYTPQGDIYLGRQAITWGNSNLFTTGDIWTRFSPFELDTSQKRGVDAVRFLGYPAGIELDLVFEWTDFDSPGAGARAAWTLDRTDSYGAIAWRDDELLGLMGLGVDLDVVRAHGEISIPYSLDDDRLRLPRATVGFDYLSQEWSVIVEYHYNGPGTAQGDYIGQATSEDVASGQRYLLGRHYAGFASSWAPNETYTLSVATFANLVDPSLLVTPTATISLSQNVTFTAGSYLGIGERPELQPTPSLDSEFGAAGNVFFVQLTGYY